VLNSTSTHGQHPAEPASRKFRFRTGRPADPAWGTMSSRYRFNLQRSGLFARADRSKPPNLEVSTRRRPCRAFPTGADQRHAWSPGAYAVLRPAADCFFVCGTCFRSTASIAMRRIPPPRPRHWPAHRHNISSDAITTADRREGLFPSTAHRSSKRSHDRSRNSESNGGIKLDTRSVDHPDAGGPVRYLSRAGDDLRVTPPSAFSPRRHKTIRSPSCRNGPGDPKGLSHEYRYRPARDRQHFPPRHSFTRACSRPTAQRVISAFGGGE